MSIWENIYPTVSLQAHGNEGEDGDDDAHAPFMKKPFCIYKGHTGDLLDISWSKVSLFLPLYIIVRLRS